MADTKKNIQVAKYRDPLNSSKDERAANPSSSAASITRNANAKGDKIMISVAVGFLATSSAQMDSTKYTIPATGKPPDTSNSSEEKILLTLAKINVNSTRVVDENRRVVTNELKLDKNFLFALLFTIIQIERHKITVANPKAATNMD